MKKTLRCIAMMVLVAIMLGCAPARREQPQSGPDRTFHILFISSYSYSWPTVSLQIAGIQSVLDASASLDMEFMDTKMIPEELAEAELTERLMIKREHQPFDAVIVGDDAALMFAINHRESLFPGIPIVFEGINNIEYAEAVSEDPLVSGVIEKYSYDENLEFARSIQPNATRVVAIVDNTPSGIGEQQQFFEQRELHPELTFDVINSSELTGAELVERISAIGSDTILLYLILSEDAEGKLYTLHQSCNLLRENAKVPVYRFVRAGIGEGVLGGKIVLHDTSGEIAAQMVMKMLCDGVFPMEMQRESPNSFYLDAQVMERFGISRDLVPEGAVVINRRPDFWERYGMTILLAMGMAAGMVVVLGLIIHGVSGRRRQKVLNAQNQQLSDAVLAAQEVARAKSVFLHSMSHDIRTPMNAIMGFTDIAKKLNTSDQVETYLDKILRSSEHLMGLINDVLDISRIESGKVLYTPEPTNLCAVTDSVLEIAQGFLAGRQLDFRVERPQEQGHCLVMTDPVRIREVLVNLLSNAVKFTDDGGTIIFSMGTLPSQDDRHIEVFFQVSDTGCGMSEEFLPHLFEEFSQEHNIARTRYKGTGLGMAITKRYVDMMGGTITVSSVKGVGSTFTVTLPMEPSVEQNVCHQTVVPVQLDLKGIRVLVVEDNEMNAEIVRFQLEDVGMVVTTVEDGQQAVDLFAEKPAGTFDVILMDVMMPVLDGYGATKRIRAMEHRPDGKRIPIIAMTANAFVEDVQASLDAGMDAHLAKPLAMDEVLKTISSMVGSSGWRAAKGMQRAISVTPGMPDGLLRSQRRRVYMDHDMLH